MNDVGGHCSLARTFIIYIDTRKKRGTECSTSLFKGSGKPAIKDTDTIQSTQTREPLPSSSCYCVLKFTRFLEHKIEAQRFIILHNVWHAGLVRQRWWRNGILTLWPRGSNNLWLFRRFSNGSPVSLNHGCRW